MKRFFGLSALLLLSLCFALQTPAEVASVGDDGPPALAMKSDDFDPFASYNHVTQTPPVKAKRSLCRDCDCEAGAPCCCPSCPRSAYEAAYAAALAEDVPLVVFVGQPLRYVAGVLSVWAAKFPGANGPCVVVSRPINGRLCRVQDLAGAASLEAIQQALGVAAAPIAPPPPPPQAFFQGGFGFGGGCAGGAGGGGG